MSSRPPLPPRGGSSKPPRPERQAEDKADNRAGRPTIDAGAALQSTGRWWRNASRRRKTFVIVLALIALIFLMRLAGCGADPSSDSVRAARGNTETAAVLDDMKSALAQQEVIKSSSTDLGLTVWFQKSTGWMIVESASDDVVIDGSGNRWRWSGGCWQRSGSAPLPEAAQVVLPLSESSAQFDKVKSDQGRQTLPFSAEQLGSWSAGAGSIEIDDGLPRSFTYTIQGSDQENKFVVSYPSSLPLEEIKRCSPKS